MFGKTIRLVCSIFRLQKTETVKVISFLIAVFALSSGTAQEIKPNVAPGSRNMTSISPAGTVTSAPPILHMPSLESKPSKPKPEHKKIKKHYDPIQEHFLDSIKQAKMRLVLADSNRIFPDEPQRRGPELLELSPQVNREFEGNTFNGSSPPDNAMAISNAGWIVSIVNNTVSYFDENGNIILDSEDLSDYFDFLDIPNSHFFDPKIIYDPTTNKFILVCLHGTTPSTSKIIISFSTSNNPTQSWWTYVFDGNIANAGVWFDFPLIGLSTNDLYITGNLFNSNNNFHEAVILQFNKSAGYSGLTLSYTYWNNIFGGDNQLAFSIKPVSHGYNSGYGPGIYAISAKSGGGSNIQLFDITQDFGNNPVLQVSSITCTSYGPSSDALQLGSTSLLQTNDCRILEAFYAGGKIHYVHHNDRNNYNGIRYGIVDVANSSISVTTFGLDGYAYTYPSIAPIDAGPSENPNVVIGFTRSGANIYPEMRVVTVENDFTFQDPYR